MLVIFSGLPAVGKTTMARELARQIGAAHLRIDSIEQAIRGSATGTQPFDDIAYRVAYAVAEDNLRIGRTVIADSVNPLRLTLACSRNCFKRYRQKCASNPRTAAPLNCASSGNGRVLVPASVRDNKPSNQR